MVTVRKLTTEEVEALATSKVRNTGVRSRMAELYDSLVADYSTGEYAEVELGEDEKKVTVRSNLVKALARRGLFAEFRRGKNDTLRFKVVDVAPEKRVRIVRGS